MEKVSTDLSNAMREYETEMEEREWMKYFAQLDLGMMQSGVMKCLPCVRPWSEGPCCQPNCGERPEAYCFLEDCRHGACARHMVYVSNPLFEDGSSVQTAEIPLCFCHVEVTEAQILRRQALRETPTGADGDVVDHQRAMRVARTIAAAAGLEAVTGLGANAEATAPAVVVDNHYYRAAILTLTVCILAGTLLIATSGRILRSSSYTLAGML